MVEAAEVDGATSWQRIRYIILPSLKGTFIILLLFALGGIMKGNFGLFWNLTGGANSQLFPTTDIIETFVYRTMTTQNNFATSSAVQDCALISLSVYFWICSGYVQQLGGKTT